MVWSMTNAEKWADKQSSRAFKAKYGTSKKKRKVAKYAYNATKYRRWRKAVLGRDDHTCQHCGATDGLHVHHKRTWAESPTTRYKVKNGITWCFYCHDKAHDGLVSYYEQQAFLTQIMREGREVA